MMFLLGSVASVPYWTTTSGIHSEHVYCIPYTLHLHQKPLHLILVRIQLPIGMFKSCKDYSKLEAPTTAQTAQLHVTSRTHAHSIEAVLQYLFLLSVSLLRKNIYLLEGK